MSLFNESDIYQFRREGLRMLDELRSVFLQMKLTPELIQDRRAALKKIFRSIQSIANNIGFQKVGDQIQRLEKDIDLIQPGSARSPAQIDTLLQDLSKARDTFRSEQPQKSPSFEVSDSEIDALIQFEPQPQGKTLAQPVSIEEEPIRLDSGTPGKAVVIDDEPDLVATISAFLEGAGFEVFGFTEPKEALSLIDSIQPDVVLSDLSMPKMKGSALAHAIRKIDINLPIIFVSGHLDREILLDALSLGIAGAFEKPFDSERLVARAIEHARRYQLQRMIFRSVQLIMMQYAKIEKHLSPGVDQLDRDELRAEIRSLIQRRRELSARYASSQVD